MGWEFWIDRGGTFTDVVARAPNGALVVEKLLSDDPRYADAATEAIGRILAAHGAGPIDVVKMGTTVATNALLERKGAPTLLVITQGMGDALRIGWQARPDIFARRITLPAPLYERVIEAEERVAVDGEVLTPLNEARLRAALVEAHQDGLRAAAIVFMHGWRCRGHERRAGEIAREIGFTQVSLSHEVAPLIKLVSRGDTSVVDAYLSPVLRAYVDQLERTLTDRARLLLFMQSSGGLIEARAFRGKDAVLSGPAGGVVGMAAVGKAAGFNALIGFDMGGTSTDVCRFEERFERAEETQIAGVRLRAPILSIHSIAAGGGSICRFDGARLRVGPQSAGADPGPACYRRGGPLTITDCNVALGKIRAEHFPKVFGANGAAPLDTEASRLRLEEIADQIAAAGDPRPDSDTLAEGFVAIAVEAMASAIKKISTERGHDPARHALVAFGGAGGQHACLVADALGVEHVLIHPLAGVLSAVGIGQAPLRVVNAETIELDLTPPNWTQVVARVDEMAIAAERSLRAQGVPLRAAHASAQTLLKYHGADATIALDLAANESSAREAFERAHRAQFGFASPGERIVVETISVEAVGEAAGATLAEGLGEWVGAPAARHSTHAARPERSGELIPRAPAFFAGQRVQAPIFERSALPVGARIDGPAVICDAAATTIVEPGWRADAAAGGHLVLTRTAPTRTNTDTAALDPIRLELFNNRFMAAAERMGVRLQNTAASVNIKERLDFSCAIFDAAGALVANAPHIPVHLGSMSDSVRAIIDARGASISDGDMFMLNAPYRGGTHLPDITVIAPVFLGASPAYFVAARGHHADIGGLTPGSMPPHSTRIEQEGVLIDDFVLVAKGAFQETATRALLASGRWPARNVDQNILDLKAQAAACVAGVNDLRAMTDAYGREVVDAYMRHMQDNAEEAARRVISTLTDSQFVNRLDGDIEIRVRLSIDRAARSAVVDFTGTSAQHAGNFNAPLSVTRAAVLYVCRTLVDDAIPLNEGCLRPFSIVAPEGCLLNPRYPAAVVAGNVETSQAIVDTLYGAMGMLAASQGTMNNFTFGDQTRQYYETICGGAGAGPGFDGASAVHTHMTNSRLTDPEVLESRFPVLVERFAIRRGSGGAGARRGGDGTVRKIRFRAPMTAAIVSSRRTTRPFGLAGGAPGAPGANSVERASGETETAPAVGETSVCAGDAFVIETPGGGGYGQC